MKLDPFLLSLIGAIGLASIAPVDGQAAQLIGTLSFCMIVFMFFAHGLRLSREAVLSAIKNWRLHVMILSITFVLYPILGVGAQALFGGALSPGLSLGIVYLTLVPSTVQSSIAFTAAAKGDVASAVASAAASNSLGVIITPLLASLLLHEVGATGAGVGSGLGASLYGVIGLILAPFITGHLLRPWFASWGERYGRFIAFNDKAAIVVIVYAGFSAAILDRFWERVEPLSLMVMVVICALLLAIVLGIVLGLSRAAGLKQGQVRAALFCASQKSLAAGAPMAKILIAGPIVGEVLIPLLVFHQMQLFLAAALAGRLAKSN